MKSGVRKSFLLASACLMIAAYLETAAAKGKMCTTAAGEPGNCVRFERCTTLNSTDKDNSLISVDILLCSFIFFKGMICCPLERKPNTTTTNIIPRSTRAIVQVVEKESTTADSEPTSQVVKNEPKNGSRSYGPLLPPHCGQSDALHNRIVGGNEAELNAWPWMAAVYFRFGELPDEIAFSCGGSLISARHVVTAAHCLQYEEVTYQVRLGEHNLERTDDGAHPVDVAVESYVIHPGYNDTTKENDIAVFRLERDVEFTIAIHPICLPIGKSVRKRNFVNTYPFIAGWGTTSYGGEPSDVLEEVQVPVVSNEQCKKDYEDKDVVIDERVLCAGWPNGGKDACQGDSGGPLMWPRRKTYFLIGVVSAGSECAIAHFPGIYSRVTYFLDFIISNLK